MKSDVCSVMSPFIIEPLTSHSLPLTIKRLDCFAIARNDEKSSILYMWAVFIPSPLEGEGWKDGKREKPRRIRATSLTKGGTGWVALLSLAMTKNPVSFTCGQCSFPLPLRERVRVRGVMNMFNVLPIT